MKRAPRKIMRDERGQSLVEFALTLPMLLVVMFMITEFGRALYQYNVLAQATREAARVAVVSAEDQAPTVGEAKLDEFLNGTGISPADLSTRTVAVEDDAGVKIVRATATLPFRWILQGDLPTNPDGASTVSPGALTLSAETVMKAETF